MQRSWITLFALMGIAVNGSLAEPSEPERIVSHISRQPVQSSAIAKLAYSKRCHMREIEFAKGAVYRYLDVPPAVYRGLMSADSKARFYESNIRRHYRSMLVRPRQRESTRE